MLESLNRAFRASSQGLFANNSVKGFELISQ